MLENSIANESYHNQEGHLIKESIATLIAKLENYQTHTPQEIAILEQAVSEARVFAKDEDIIRQGDNPTTVYLVVEGWVCRYRVSTEGKPQILNYLIPGDFCNLHTTLVKQIDHTITALTRASVAFLPHDKVYEIYERHPRLARSLDWLALNEMSILQEWLVNLGSRPADQRLAHLLCELLVRSRAAGLTDNHHFRMPLTQAQLGEAMGITQVHTNRVMKKLREEELITFDDRIVNIIDWRGMKEYAGFDGQYLHLDQADPGLKQEL